MGQTRLDHGVASGFPEMSQGRFNAWLIRPVRHCGLDFLSADEIERASRFAREEDRDNFASTRTALRCLLAEFGNVHPSELRFDVNPWGKPELRPRDPASPEFNVSHADGLAVIALAHRARIGVDVERERAIPDLNRIAADVFDAAVVQRLARVTTQERDALFLRVWTAGEAWVKAAGTGLAGRAPPVPVAVSPEGLPVLRPDHGQGSWTLVPLTLPAGYVGALVVEATLAAGTCCEPSPIDLDALVARCRR